MLEKLPEYSWYSVCKGTVLRLYLLYSREDTQKIFKSAIAKFSLIYLRLLYRLRGFEDEAAAYFRPYIQVSLDFISEDDPQKKYRGLYYLTTRE